MAKRFTDTAKWEKNWFRELTPKLKCAWDYLVERCDHAGIWDVDMGTMSHFIGEVVSLSEIKLAFGDKLQFVDGGNKIFLPSFIDFQYKHLNPNNRVHQSAINRLDKVGALKPLAEINKPHSENAQGAQYKYKDADTDTYADAEKEKGGVGEKKPALPISEPQAAVKKCGDAWVESLKQIGIERASIRAEEETEIFRALNAHGEETVYLALVGARFQKKTEKWDPKDYPSIVRIIGKDKNGVCKISQFADLALAHQTPPDNPESAELKKFTEDMAMIESRIKNGS